MLAWLPMIRRRRAHEGFFWSYSNQGLYVGSGSFAARGFIQMPEIRLVSNLPKKKGYGEVEDYQYKTFVRAMHTLDLH